MTINPLTDFAYRFGSRVALNPEFMIEKSQRFYLLNPALRKVARSDFFYSGLYLGKVKNGTFFPSFNFLNMVVPLGANKVILERKAAWLFICGRDIFRKGIIKLNGSKKRGDFTLVMNEFGECLGFGVVTGNFEEEGKVSVRNVLDIGDFLRREKQL
jgi:ribosome biogenesis protein Nip4